MNRYFLLLAIGLAGCGELDKSPIEKRVEALESTMKEKFPQPPPKRFVKIENDEFENLMKDSGWKLEYVNYIGDVYYLTFFRGNGLKSKSVTYNTYKSTVE